MLEKAETQQIPYSVVKVSCEPKIGRRKVRISEAPSIVHRRDRMNGADVKTSRRKRGVPQKVKETV
jgi:hypothetical protein